MIKIDIAAPIGYDTQDLKNIISKSIPVSQHELSEIKILRRELALLDKSNIHYKMSVAISLSEERERGLLKMRKRVSAYEPYFLDTPPSYLKTRPVVVGSGPCGLFAALLLAKSGSAPIILERGKSVEERAKSVNAFYTLGVLDPESNVQFGEGGAGTYSDGKLKVGSMDKYKAFVLDEFVNNGADEEILYSKTAHVGTDKLSQIVKKIREKIISLGGEFIFDAKLCDIKIKDGKVIGAVYERASSREYIDTENIIIATGHSARDTLLMLYNKGIAMQPKGFGIGVRIEHPREYIDNLIYGENHTDKLETASYHLVTHLSGGRSVYSFCMCPGGTVVAAANEHGGIVTNGMSEHSRMADNSNAAILVSVTAQDFPTDSPLSGIDLQRDIERAAYSLTSSYLAPSIRLDSFMSSEKMWEFGSVLPSYPLGTVKISPEKYLPDYITDSLRCGIKDFDEWLGGYYLPDAVITGPETRTTSPVRILRGENYQTPTVRGLYPAGEGAGYSGGIISSAVDGVRVAEALLLENK